MGICSFGRIACGLLLGGLLFSSAARADVQVPKVFSNHMVLQREMATPIYGTAEPGEKVTVAFRDQQQEATAAADGTWRVMLKPLKAGGPDSLRIAGKNQIEIGDVLVGEVWLGSGQSNMAGSANGYLKGDPVLAEMAGQHHAQIRLLKGGGTWNEGTPENNRGYSALLFAFGVRLQQELKVPVGLMVGAVGGTPSGYWLRPEHIQNNAACQEALKAHTAAVTPEMRQKQFDSELALWEKASAAAKAQGKKEPKKPTRPGQPGEASGGATGHLYEQHIRPLVGYGMRGVLWDQGEAGTRVTGLDQFTLMGALISGWRSDWGQGEFPFLYVQKPSGGGCAFNPALPISNKADPFASLPVAPLPTADGMQRELHIRIMQHPKTAMVIASDLGSGIHPVNKSGYGTRASQVALGFAYGQPVEYYGPLYEAHEVKGNSIRLKFGHAKSGLVAAHGEKLQGFSVAGADKVFHWAEAKIEDIEVVIACERVAQPVAVRYAWGRTHSWANLFNQNGLPAIPFRTDEW